MLLSLALLVTLSAHAQARPQQDPQALIVEAHKELRDIDSLIDDADRRAVQHDLHEKVDDLDKLLTEIATSPALRPHDHDHDDVHVHTGDNGLAIAATAGDHAEMHDHDGDMHDHDGDMHDHDVHAPPPRPTACTAADFAQVQHAIQNEPFDDGKKRVLSSAIHDRWFDVGQVKAIVKDFSFPNDQVDAAATLYSHVVDPQNWYQIYDVFPFDSDKEALRKRVGQ